MKVIGKEIKIYQMICPYCSAIIEFEENDINKGLIPYFNHAQCPVCKKNARVGSVEKYLSRVETKCGRVIT